MPARPSPAPAAVAYRRPFLLTSAVARVCLALVVSGGLWAMTMWALG